MKLTGKRLLASVPAFCERGEGLIPSVGLVVLGGCLTWRTGRTGRVTGPYFLCLMRTGTVCTGLVDKLL